MKYPNAREFIALADQEISAADILLKAAGPSRHIRRHCHGTAELLLKAYLASRGVEKYIHDLDILLTECLKFDPTFQTLAPDVALLARDYPADRGEAGCEASVEAHYNLQDDFSISEACTWFEAVVRTAHFVKGKV